MSTFDREIWETRGRIPHYITDTQKAEIEGATFRVSSQLSFLAQMMGLNGPRYWPKELMSVEQMRALPLGSFSSDGRLPEPSKTIADKGFKIVDGEVYSLENELAPSYSQPVTLFVGFEYEFEGYLDLEGSEYDAIDDKTRWFPEEVTENIEIEGALFEVNPYPGFSGEDYLGFLGYHGSKGNEKALHWALDSTGFHGYSDESLTVAPCLMELDFSTIPPGVNQGSHSNEATTPVLVAKGGSFSYTMEEGGLMFIPPQKLSQDLEVFARYPSEVLDDPGSYGYTINEDGIDLVEAATFSGGTGYFEAKVFSYWGVNFPTVFTPDNNNSTVPLRVKGFKDVQVW